MGRALAATAPRTAWRFREAGKSPLRQAVRWSSLTVTLWTMKRYAAKGIKSDYVFVNERGELFGRMGIARKIERAGEAAGLSFSCMCICCGIQRPGS